MNGCWYEFFKAGHYCHFTVGGLKCHKVLLAISGWPVAEGGNVAFVYLDKGKIPPLKLMLRDAIVSGLFLPDTVGLAVRAAAEDASSCVRDPAAGILPLSLFIQRLRTDFRITLYS